MIRDQTHAKIFFFYFLPVFLATAAVALRPRRSTCTFTTLKRDILFVIPLFVLAG